MQIDFYTTIIDNYGDMGFSFNLAISLLYYYPDLKIRYFCDNKDLFLKLKGDKEIKNLTYYDLKEIKNSNPSKTIFNFFDKKIDFDYFHSFDYKITLINFSYFLLHSGVANFHNTHYTSKNVEVTHFIPSLLPNTGGIIINSYILEYKKNINKNWISVFCYKETFTKLKEIILKDKENTYFVFDNYLDGDNVVNMPFLSIMDYYKFCNICDKNIVRGENSLVNSLLTGKSFLWDIYKEHNEAHKEKIDDFSNYLISNFGNDFLEYNAIFKEFNILDTKKGFKEFLNYKNNFEIIGEKIIVQNDLIKNLSKYI